MKALVLFPRYIRDGDGVKDCFDMCPNDKENDIDSDLICDGVDKYQLSLPMLMPCRWLKLNCDLV